MPTEELGAPAYRKYDIEAWMPFKNGYGEARGWMPSPPWMLSHLETRSAAPRTVQITRVGG
jgi:seryl-tRNA synthetase